MARGMAESAMAKTATKSRAKTKSKPASKSKAKRPAAPKTKRKPKKGVVARIATSIADTVAGVIPSRSKKTKKKR